MERKAKEDLLNWKNTHDGKPLIIYGPRQVGKTYLVREFAKRYYENLYEINFELNQELVKFFNGDLTVDNILLQLSAYQINNKIKPQKTLIFFDEIQRCPNAITLLKAFAMDKRYDVIASGSLLGVSMSSVSSYPVGYVRTLYMKPFSFEEFLWANNYSKEDISKYQEFFDNEQEVLPLIHSTLNKLFLEYIIVGGMPEAVKTFVETKDFGNVYQVQKDILDLYLKDVTKYASNNLKEKIKDCFNSIPAQLAMDNKKFQFKYVKPNGSGRYYYSSIAWLEDAGLVYKVHRLKTFDRPLKAYKDLASFKLYFVDTGLLLAMYEEPGIQSEILNGNLGIFKGALFENVIVENLIANDMPVYYYRKDNKLEIDFVTFYDNKIVPIEVKSGRNTQSISFNHVIRNHNLDYGIKLSLNNVNCSNKQFKCFPLYMVMFIK